MEHTSEIDHSHRYGGEFVDWGNGNLLDVGMEANEEEKLDIQDLLESNEFLEAIYSVVTTEIDSMSCCSDCRDSDALVDQTTCDYVVTLTEQAGPQHHNSNCADVSLPSEKQERKRKSVCGGPSRRSSKKKPKGFPKRPLSAYNLFFKSERPNILFEAKTEKLKITFEELGKRIGQRWHLLNEDKRKEFSILADADVTRYRTEMNVFEKSSTKETDGKIFKPCVATVSPRTPVKPARVVISTSTQKLRKYSDVDCSPSRQALTVSNSHFGTPMAARKTTKETEEMPSLPHITTTHGPQENGRDNVSLKLRSSSIQSPPRTQMHSEPPLPQSQTEKDLCKGNDVERQLPFGNDDQICLPRALIAEVSQSETWNGSPPSQHLTISFDTCDKASMSEYDPPRPQHDYRMFSKNWGRDEDRYQPPTFYTRSQTLDPYHQPHVPPPRPAPQLIHYGHPLQLHQSPPPHRHFSTPLQPSPREQFLPSSPPTCVFPHHRRPYGECTAPGFDCVYKIEYKCYRMTRADANSYFAHISTEYRDYMTLLDRMLYAPPPPGVEVPLLMTNLHESHQDNEK